MIGTRRIGFKWALLLAVLLLTASSLAWAAPEPQPASRSIHALPEPRPKLLLSTKGVEPPVIDAGGTVTYSITLLNSGATAAPDTYLWDAFPAGTTYNGDASASSGEIITGPAGLTWTGEVAFDSSVVITFSVTTDPTYTGSISNTAVLTQADIPQALTLTAFCTATDRPILRIVKEGDPLLPGAGKALSYTLWVGNSGQPALGLPMTVTDRVPSYTALLAVGPDAITDTQGHITWTRPVTLALGQRTPFTFSVLVDEGVPSGTVLLNEGYAVATAISGVGALGEPYTLTVVDPILLLTKQTEPDPPGSNRSMVYTLTLYNRGSLATGIVITDVVPTNVTYISGGTYLSATDTVSWTLPQLASGENAAFTYSVHVGNLPGGTPIVNDNYSAYCSEGIWVAGRPLTSTIQGPIFDKSFKIVDPIAMKPGGGQSTLTYTIGIRNTGAGTALDAQMVDQFYYVSFDESNVVIDPPTGAFTLSNCGAHCEQMLWVGDVEHESQITFTIGDISNSFSGQEVVTNTAWISDDLTLPVSATSRMLVTHDARLNVYKDGPVVIGPNEVMTYSFYIRNSAFTTGPTGTEWLTDVLPIEVTYLTSSHGGVFISETGMVSWTLPTFGTGDSLTRSLTVQVGDWPSGTLIVNEDFRAGCGNCVMTDTIFDPVTTTVRIGGLGDSYKEVRPALSYPGHSIMLTYTVHVVNSGGLPMNGIYLTDYLPWPVSTYNRDAIASAGSVISDIVHLEWTGSLAPHTAATITLSVVVDPWYEGAVTNTAVITHPSLADPLTLTAIAYITDLPVLRLGKKASPDPVPLGDELLYTLRLRNLGQVATDLVISDTVPDNTTYVDGSATKGGELVGDTVVWVWPELEAGTTEILAFRVTVDRGSAVRNSLYWAGCAEDVWAYGDPLETQVIGGGIYLPLVFKGYSD